MVVDAENHVDKRNGKLTFRNYLKQPSKLDFEKY